MYRSYYDEPGPSTRVRGLRVLHNSRSLLRSGHLSCTLIAADAITGIGARVVPVALLMRSISPGVASAASDRKKQGYLRYRTDMVRRDRTSDRRMLSDESPRAVVSSRHRRFVARSAEVYPPEKTPNNFGRSARPARRRVGGAPSSNPPPGFRPAVRPGPRGRRRPVSVPVPLSATAAGCARAAPQSAVLRPHRRPFEPQSPCPPRRPVLGCGWTASAVRGGNRAGQPASANTDRPPKRAAPVLPDSRRMVMTCFTKKPLRRKLARTLALLVLGAAACEDPAPPAA